MLIPWKAETPSYSGATHIGHFPWVTIGLIIGNVVTYFLTGWGDPDLILPWSLEYGNGMHPVQWISHLFMHMEALHLIGNMLFLWVFGMVVEGRLGWWKFLLVYLGLGIAEGLFEQLATFWFEEGFAAGASGAIYGLLAMSLIWAPDTEIQWLLIVRSFGMRAAWDEVQIPVLGMAVIYIGMDILTALFANFRVGTATLHVIGAVLGGIGAVALLRLRWVDCEG
ncbi:MAG: rhomboid family intramembrane serine protease [Planctomycetales bacterium]